ncbi:unnamed protein product [Caenorhabditis nigoni]
MKKLIESSSQMQRFKIINAIKYDHLDEGTFVCIPVHGFPDNVIQIAERDDTENDYFQLNVPGKMIDFRISYEDNKYLPVASYQPDERETLVASIHDYLLDFFGDSVEYYWHAHDYETPIPHLQNLIACLELNTSEDILDMENLENFISLSPVLKSIDMYISNVTAPFSQGSKFYQTEYIQTCQEEPNLPDILHHFQGRQASVEIVRYNIGHVIEFVNAWKSGEAFDKLEHIIIEIILGRYRENEILHAIGAKHIDSAKKPPTHVLPKVYRDMAFDKDPNTDPITSYTYVVRETDNRVASVLVQGRRFDFGVWDKTEEEFLRMME